MVDKKEVLKLLRASFETKGTVTIDAKGLVSCKGYVNLKKTHITFPVHFHKVGEYFWCFTNSLVSLEGAPQHVGQDFDCSENQLTTLAGAPLTVGRSFQCNFNQLNSLVGAPRNVPGDFDCSHNQLTSLEGAPAAVGRLLSCLGNPLTSLEGMPNSVGIFEFTYSPTLPLLRSLVAKKINVFPKLETVAIQNILNKYAGQGRAGAIDCKRELVAAGFEGNARW